MANQKARSTLAINTQNNNKKRFSNGKKSLSGQVCSELVANVVADIIA